MLFEFATNARIKREIIRVFIRAFVANSFANLCEIFASFVVINSEAIPDKEKLIQLLALDKLLNQPTSSSYLVLLFVHEIIRKENRFLG